MSSRCIPCEAKAELNRQKVVFLYNTGILRAKSENQDYVIYFDDDNTPKLCPYAVAIERGETIYRIISRFEGTNLR